MTRPGRATARDAIARTAVHRALARLTGATVELVDPWGHSVFGADDSGTGVQPACVRLTVHEPRVYSRLLRDGSVGLGESYADGWWDVDDLAGFLRIAHRNLARTHPLRDRIHRAARPVVDPISRLRRPDKQRDARNVRAHYDLGDDLFRCLLDDTMMYSCAYFASPEASLETASLAKLERLARTLDLERGDRVLEIGTGWGGFAVFVAQRYGCHVTTTTTSERQLRYATDRVRGAGLDHLVTVRGEDYRDVRGKFDKVIAIEMIEAVDWREYDSYFASCRDLVTDVGLLVLQAIVVPDEAFDRAKHHTDFIKAAIFPGGCLPSIEALTTAAVRNDFSIEHSDDMGLHYAETLRRWRANLSSRRGDLEQLGYDARFARLWEFYFSYCEAGFDERYVSVVQMAFSAPAWTRRPLRVAPRAARHLSIA